MIVKKDKENYYHIEAEKSKIYFNRAEYHDTMLVLFTMDGQYIGYFEKSLIDNWKDVEQWFPKYR